MTFQELFDNWRAVKRAEVRPGTLACQANHWKSLQPYLGEMQIDAFGRNEARALLGRLLESGLSRHTSRDRMCMVKQMLLFAAVELSQTIKPLEWNLKYPDREPRRLQRFTEGELRRILAVIRTEFINGSFSYLPVLISAMTGMRIGEVCGLQWGDIDFKHRMLYVHRNVTRCFDPFVGKERKMIGTPKTRAGFREIPLHPFLCKMLRMARPKNTVDDMFVISNSTTPAMSPAVRDKFERCLKKCHGVPKINFHGLRHTFASILIESKADVKTVSEILGHSNVSTTLNLYVHPSLDAKKKVVAVAFKKIIKTIEQ